MILCKDIADEINYLFVFEAYLNDLISQVYRNRALPVFGC